MSIEKILVGDDSIEFAKKSFPYIPNAEIEFVSTPEEVIRKGKTGQYNIIVTDLNYTPEGQEGFKVLEELKGLGARLILWTGNAYDAGIRQRGESLGADVLDKDEIGALVGQAVNKAPLKKDGKVFIYVRDGPVAKAIDRVARTLLGKDNVDVGSQLKEALETGQYGLVIDTSPMMDFGREKSQGVVAHDMKYIKLAEVPRVATVHDVTTVVQDIVKIAGQFLSQT